MQVAQRVPMSTSGEPALRPGPGRSVMLRSTRKRSGAESRHWPRRPSPRDGFYRFNSPNKLCPTRGKNHYLCLLQSVHECSLRAFAS